MTVKHAPVILIFLCLFFEASAQITYLDVSPKTIGLKDTCKIRWSVQTTDSVFLYPFGFVKPTGEIDTSFIETTLIVLIHFSNTTIYSDSITVKIKGGETKGPLDALPQQELYEYPLTINRESKNGNLLVQKIFSILQDTLNFSVAKNIASDSSIIFQTRPSKKDYLTTEKDRSNLKIDYRTISYLVEIKKPIPGSSMFNISISSFIQFKKIIYSDLKKETAEELYIKQNNKLKQFIN